MPHESEIIVTRWSTECHCSGKDCIRIETRSCQIDEVFEQYLAKQKQSLIFEILDYYKVCRTDEGFITYLKSL